MGPISCEEEDAAQTFEVAQESLESFFAGFTEESQEQATLSAGHSGIGCKRTVDVARPAHLVVFLQQDH